jgi:hypothetical protein
MTDEVFVRDARKRWGALLEKTETWDANTLALAVSLWATLNVDRLLDIAERKAPPA